MGAERSIKAIKVLLVFDETRSTEEVKPVQIGKDNMLL